MAGRFIDKLKKAARLDPVKKEIQLDSGEYVVMYVSPLTAAERERARQDADDQSEGNTAPPEPDAPTPEPDTSEEGGPER